MRATAGKAKSDPFQLAHCPFVLDISRVQCGLWFQQHDVHFFVRDRQVLDAARHNDKFTFPDNGFVVPELHAKRSLDD